jgi:heme exporter protein C
MNKIWWKILCVIFLCYTLVAGFMFPVPSLDILNETIRNLYFHVPMWFTQLFLYSAGVYFSVRHLMKVNVDDGFGGFKNDVYSKTANTVGTVFGSLGLITGSVWAKFTWGAFWTNDPKLNSVAIGMLLYFAYFILRGSMDDIDKRARLSAVYNIFSYPIYIVLIMVIPRLTDSIHPGNGGNPAFAKYDLDSNMRLVFYPAVIAWILLGSWITSLLIRAEKINFKILFKN